MDLLAGGTYGKDNSFPDISAVPRLAVGATRNTDKLGLCNNEGFWEINVYLESYCIFRCYKT